ncbi:hypothetical protein [Synechococcus sp. PCC 7336]|uniref:hypothetical protein n=1 Tax=Synechococcus sp. PCC 7336 TaxID=195250 RepID=UPI00034C3F5C|nr:hypothetical protein [Synechococcus sp. PCC 7336]
MHSIAILALWVPLLALSPLPLSPAAFAQSGVPLTAGTLNTAKNFARQAAERANGGLSNYRAELSMHGPALESPYVDGGDRWIFTFRGGFPGRAPTIESQVSVDKSTLETVILYNGPVRTAAPPPATPSPAATAATANLSPPANRNDFSATADNRSEVRPTETSLRAPGDLNTAKNFARQAAERANGGLSNYRAEPAMHGPALESPYVDAGDRWIFTFLGAPPGRTTFRTETEVSVDKRTLEPTVVYNGPLRNRRR